MRNPASTTCAKCRRVVFVTDVNADGMCCFCEAPAHGTPKGFMGSVTPLKSREVVVPMRKGKA